jgi:hypothetical protein
MRNLILALAAIIGLITAISTVSSNGATLKQNAVCAVSEATDTIAESLLQQGDQKAFQLLVDSHQVGFLNDTQVVIVSNLLNEYLAIRVVGTLDVYYTYYTNVLGSPELDAALEAIRLATQEAHAFNQKMEEQNRKIEAQNAALEEELRKANGQ